MGERTMKDSFVFHRDFNNIIDALPPEKAVILIHVISDYSMDGIVPEFDDPLLKVAFSGIVGMLDRDSDKYDEKCSKNRENGKLGGRPKENLTVIEETERLSNNRTQPNKPDTDTDIDTDIEHDTDTELEPEKKKRLKRQPSPKPSPYYPNDPALNDAFTAYVENRKALRSPMTDRAVSLAIKHLQELSGGDDGKAIAILNQSVENGWKGLFELKSNGPHGKPNKFNEFEQRNYDFDELETKLLAGGTS